MIRNEVAGKMMMSAQNNKSPFAHALKGLLDDTNVFDRSEWAEVLGVSEPAISQWVGDKTIPRPDNLHMIIITLERSTGVNKAPLRSFKAMAQLKATEVSRHGKRMLPSVWEYMMRPAFSELSGRLAKLPIAEQERLLESTFGDDQSSEAPTDAESQRTYRQPITLRMSTDTLDRATTYVIPPGHSSFAVPCIRSQWLTTCFEQEPALPHEPIAPLRFQVLTTEQPSESKALYDWEEVSKNPALLIIGEPGSGKTTFFHQLAHRANVPWSSGNMKPLYMHLGCFSEKRSWDDLSSFLREAMPTDESPSRTLVFFDAFDEVQAENRSRLAAAIKRFQDKSPQVRVVVTSRPTPDLQALRYMTWCKIEPPSESRLLVWIFRELSERLAPGGKGWDQALLNYVSRLRERPDFFRELKTPLFLSHAAQLFVRHDLTAFHEADLIQAFLRLLLDDWDQKKNLIRLRNSWARPGHLFQLLSALSYYALLEQRNEFSADDAEQWIKKYSQKTPIDEILRILSETTGIIQPSSPHKWSIVHATFQEYLAAKYVVESSDDATIILKTRLNEPRMANVLKYACAVTPDASKLLRFALKAKWQEPADKVAVLGKIITQPFNADSNLIEESCSAIVDWLNSSLDKWRITLMDNVSQVPAPKWGLAAQKTGRSRLDPQVARNLLQSVRAVHRARLSPAMPYLRESLKASDNENVNSLGDSLEVEGYLQAQLLQTGDDVLIAQVSEV